MSLILDTGVIVAAARPTEREHEACASLLAGAREQRVVPSPVLVEVHHQIGRNPAWERLLSDIGAGALTVEDLLPKDYERVAELLRTYRDLKADFVDCAVLAVVERLNETKLATLDRRDFTVMRPLHVESLELLPSL